MPILWMGVEQFADTRDYDQFTALLLDKQRQMVKAREIAEKAAFADLPPNEQRQYIAFALDAMNKETVS